MYIAAIVLCVAGAIMAIAGDTWSGRQIVPRLGSTVGGGPSPSPAPAGMSLDERLNGSLSPSAAVTDELSIFWATVYTKCGHMKVREAPPDLSMVGKTLEQFAGYYPEYKMTLESGNVRMERAIGQYCPDHYIIKSDGTGSIYVYRNMEGLDKLTMVTKLTFSADKIPPDYRPLLEEGMAFGSIEEIEGLIEDAES
jgi:hypothetical protein